MGEDIDYCIEGWTGPEAPREDSIQALAERLITNQNSSRHTDYYAPYVVILQSSGTGKSRTMMQLNTRNIPVLYFCLRENDQGWPPSDWVLREFFIKHRPTSEQSDCYHQWAYKTNKRLLMAMSDDDLEELKKRNFMFQDMCTDEVLDSWLARIAREHEGGWIDSETVAGIPSYNICWQHLLAMCFIYSILKYVNERIENGKTLEVVLSDMNDQVGRSPFDYERAEVLKDIEGIAKRKVEEIWGDGWFDLFRPEEFNKPLSSRWFWEDIGQLKNNPLLTQTVRLSEKIRSGQKTDMPLVIALDEITGLGTPNMGGEDSQSKDHGVIYALTRCMSIFRPTRNGQKPAVWFLLATTSSITELLAPPVSSSSRHNTSVPSSRRVTKVELPPLLTWPFFHDFYFDLWYPHTHLEPFLNPSSWAEIGYVTCFGRPLWNMYRDPETLEDMVWNKLNGGRNNSTPRRIYSMMNKDQVAFGHFALATLSHLIVLDPVPTISGDFDMLKTAVNRYIRYCHSMDINEQIITTETLSDPPVAWVLMRTFRECPQLFDEVVKKLVNDLKQPGCVNLGDFGELYARLTMINTRLFKTPDTCDIYASVENFLTGWLKIGSFEKQFTIEDQHAASLHKLATGWINFTHFWSINPTLLFDSDEFSIVLQNAFRRSAAILNLRRSQRNQRFSDLIVPVYHGDLEKEFDQNQLSFIIVQVKDRESTPFPVFAQLLARGPRDPIHDYGKFDLLNKSGDTTSKLLDQRHLEDIPAPPSNWYTQKSILAKHDVLLYVRLEFASQSRGIRLLRHTPSPESAKSLWYILVTGRTNNFECKLNDFGGIDALFNPPHSWIPDARFLDG